MEKETKTKQRIFNVAVELFSESNYRSASMRQIAKKAGINPASIYNHYLSKAAIIDDIYAYYAEQQRAVRPDIGLLMKLAETDPPLEVLLKSAFYYDPVIQPMMDRIIVIASLENRTDPRSAALIKENIFDMVEMCWGPLLRRMLELGRIEPLDIDAFLRLEANLCYSAAMRNYTTYPVTLEEWTDEMNLLLSLIKPTGK